MKLVHFYTRLEVVSGKKTLKIKSTAYWPYVQQVDANITFDNTSTPSTSEITVHGISRANAKLFTKGAQVDLFAGYFNADYSEHTIHHVTHGTLSAAAPLKNAEGDWQLTFTIKDGSEYSKKKEIKVKSSKKVREVASQRSLKSAIRKYDSKVDKEMSTWQKQHPKASKQQIRSRKNQLMTKKKSERTKLSGNWTRKKKELASKKKYRIKTVYKAMSFKPGTKGSTIIKKIAKKAGIKIATMKLVYDRKFIKGYTASKAPMACLREVARDCKTTLYWQHGLLKIADFTKQKKLNYTATSTTGLLNPPEKQDDQDAKDTWQVTLLFNAQLTAGAVFKVKHEALSGWVIVKSGTSTISAGSTPTTQVVVELYSKYKKDQAASKAKAAKKDAKAAKKDKKSRDKAKNKRLRRQKGNKR